MTAKMTNRGRERIPLPVLKLRQKRRARSVTESGLPFDARERSVKRMAQIQVTDLTFCYEGSFDNIFEDVSFGIDTDW